jgi:hypothetical protein
MARELNITTDYEPSQDTKEWWLYTRKSGKKYNDITLPGLFTTDSYSSDRSLFIIAMLIEFTSLILMILIAKANILIFGTALALIVVDVVSAIVLHMKKREICEAKNQAEYWRYMKKYELDDNASDKVLAWEKKEHELKHWYMTYIVTFIIWIIALVKSSAFFVLINGTVVFAVLALVLYLIAAYIHSRHTGYFLANWWFMKKLKKEQGAHLDAIRNRSETKDTITDHRYEPLSPHNKSIMYNNNEPMNVSISRVSESNKTNIVKENAVCFKPDSEKWVFKTWGILTDEDLYSIAHHNNGVKEARDFIAISGLNIQLKMLQQNAQKKA